jgi:hypothetical protein
MSEKVLVSIIAGSLFCFIFFAIGIEITYNKPTINCEEAIRVAYQLGQEDLVLEVIE